MGCCGGRRENRPGAQQKWDYITLSDFKGKSCYLPFSYTWLWILVIVSVAVYAVDTFTAINLLIFNRWSSKVNPAIPFAVSKWIFAVCIILSFVLLAFEWIRAVRVIRKGGVAENYLDPLAVILQSIRLNKAGWRRFLVFAELTRSKKGKVYYALGVYFAFKGAVRITLAEAPRQAVNAITLYSVMQADLLPQGAHAATQGHSKFAQFFTNVQILAQSNNRQAAILFGMLFSLIIWVFSALTLLSATLVYLVYLWGHIPARDKTLSKYCRRKINKRVEQLVDKKVVQHMEDEEKKWIKKELKAMKKGEKAALPQSGFSRQPTLPDVSAKRDEKFELSLSRANSQDTLPPYSSKPSTPGGFAGPGIRRLPTLSDIGDNEPFRPRLPTRTTTHDSTSSYSSNDSQTPWISGGPAVGYGQGYSPLTGPAQSQTGGSQRPLYSQPTRIGPTAPPTYRANAMSPMSRGLASRQNTQDSTANFYGPIDRQPTQVSEDSAYGPLSRANTGFNSAEQQIQGPSPPTYVPFNPRQQLPMSPSSRSVAQYAPQSGRPAQQIYHGANG